MVTVTDDGILSSLKVFVSYSWETDAHKDWVRRFATRLRKHGVAIVLDVWNLRLGDDLFLFMERSMTEAKYVLLICALWIN